MTKDEAIKTLKDNYCAMCAYGSQNMDSCDIRSCDNKDAIKILEQEPCEDAVSRTELHKALYERFHEEDALNNITMVTLGSVRNFIKDFPSITPQQETGKWEVDEDRIYTCNQCNKKNLWHSLYCPNCGRRMEEAEE